MENNPVFHHYTKTNSIKGAGRVSFAGVIINNSLQIGAAVCGKKEQFVRKHGRKIAEGRAAKKPFATIKLSDKLSVKDLNAKFHEVVAKAKVTTNMTIQVED